MYKVGVIFGGESVEHEISIITAVQAMNYIDSNKYEVVPIYISKDRRFYTGDILRDMATYKNLDDIHNKAKEVTLTKKNNEFVLLNKNSLFNSIVNTIDIAFPIVHGKGVEDGSLAGYLDTLDIPYVGPSILGAAVGQDKVIQKQILKSEGIPVTDFVWFYDYEYENNSKDIIKKVETLKYPVIIKPACLGSSVGIKVVNNKEELEVAITDAINYDEKVIAEKVVNNLLELDCAVLDYKDKLETSTIGEMLTKNDFLTFEDKYLTPGSKNKTKNNSTGFIIPAKIDKEIEEKVYDISLRAFKALNLSGVTRFDFLVDKENKNVYINEPNTIPGSLAFFFFTPKGKDYTSLLNELIENTIQNYKNKKKKITNFDSNVLSTFDGSNGNKTKLKAQ